MQRGSAKPSGCPASSCTPTVNRCWCWYSFVSQNCWLTLKLREILLFALLCVLVLVPVYWYLILVVLLVVNGSTCVVCACQCSVRTLYVLPLFPALRIFTLFWCSRWVLFMSELCICLLAVISTCMLFFLGLYNFPFRGSIVFEVFLLLFTLSRWLSSLLTVVDLCEQFYSLLQYREALQVHARLLCRCNDSVPLL